MVKTCPPTEMEPVREPPLLACTLKLTGPLPPPRGSVSPPVMVTQPSVVFAFQWQPAPVVTLNDPLPPSTGYNPLLGVRANVQLAGFGDWVTVKVATVCPPAVIEIEPA